MHQAARLFATVDTANKQSLASIITFVDIKCSLALPAWHGGPDHGILVKPALVGMGLHLIFSQLVRAAHALTEVRAPLLVVIVSHLAPAKSSVGIRSNHAASDESGQLKTICGGKVALQRRQDAAVTRTRRLLRESTKNTASKASKEEC